MRNGIRAAAQVGFTNIHIEGNNNILIQAVKGIIHTTWKIQVLLQDISSYLHNFTNVIINHVFRDGNCVADWLVNFGLSLHSMIVSDDVPHSGFLRLLYVDNLGRTLEKRAT